MFGLKLEIVPGTEGRLAGAGNYCHPLLVVGLELIERLIELNLSIRMQYGGFGDTWPVCAGETRRSRVNQRSV